MANMPTVRRERTLLTVTGCRRLYTMGRKCTLSHKTCEVIVLAGWDGMTLDVYLSCWRLHRTSQTRLAQASPTTRHKNGHLRPCLRSQQRETAGVPRRLLKPHLRHEPRSILICASVCGIALKLSLLWGKIQLESSWSCVWLQKEMT